MPRRLATVALLLALAAVAVVARSGGDAGSHRLNATFSSATHMRAGLEVRAAGVKVGVVDEVTTSGRHARLELRIDDDRAWPLPRGTHAQLRWGGTTAFSNRYVELVPGPDDGKGTLEEGGFIPLGETVTPVEVDQVLQNFDAAGRKDLAATIDAGGAAFSRAADPLGRVVDKAPRALRDTQGLLADLGGEPKALDTLVRSTDEAVAAIESADPGVEELISGAASTFDALAAESAALRSTLTDAARTFRATRRTLAHADPTLSSARRLAVRLAPGVRELRRATPATNAVLERVTDVGPQAAGTLRDLRAASPDLSALLTRARPLLPKLQSVGEQATEQLKCVRPYGPEIAGFPTTWAGFLANGDKHDKYARIQVASMPFPEDTPLTTRDVTRAFPGLTYAFPRPPGELVGKPWLIEECGVGPDSLDPAKDPEGAGR